MKGIIVGIEHHSAALLSEDGRVVKVRNQHYLLGQEVEIMEKRPAWKKVAAGISAAACVLLFGGVGVYAYYTPYAYVSLDVNPSIEYTLNRFNQVLSVKGVNEDGEDILDQIDLDSLKHKNIEDAISTTVGEIKDAGYFSDGTGGVMITASCADSDKSTEIADTLKETVNTTLDTEQTKVEVEATSVEPEFVDQAKAMGISPGKLKLVENLEAEAGGTTINAEDWIDRSVKDILKETNKYRERNKEASKDSKDPKDPKDQDTSDETTQSDSETTMTSDAQTSKEDGSTSAETFRHGEDSSHETLHSGDNSKETKHSDSRQEETKKSHTDKHNPTKKANSETATTTERVKDTDPEDSDETDEFEKDDDSDEPDDQYEDTKDNEDYEDHKDYKDEHDKRQTSQYESTVKGATTEDSEDESEADYEDAD